ncbi:MAG: UbiX family flavin prenyltransferase [Nitrospirae bacterium]|jgi:4-hydroxy-3-polyprenylbenzoate decarboxylase|nr:UbiX family flavin prenyltransferase [Nitrospirota bacterium]MDA8338026.1 UbiX family flavin prenyltransferase [Nitrospiraceae bacterium]
MKKYILAITGASGSIFGVRLLEELLKLSEVHLVISSNTFPIIEDETGIDWTKEGAKGKGQKAKGKKPEDIIRRHFKTDRLFFYEDKDMEAPIASGSFKTDGMLVVPCSMKTLSGIANGYANNLIERAADVVIKEGRPLLLSPREMPFSAIHLENMLKLARLGVKIAPPVPAFYQKPKNIDDIVNFIVGKILDTFSIEHTLFKRWGG